MVEVYYLNVALALFNTGTLVIGYITEFPMLIHFFFFPAMGETAFILKPSQDSLLFSYNNLLRFL